jgi:L-ascorbate metabolism protein UlaG (beta-lactamase superfamily)
VKITHLGHAGLLIETGDARILVDPGVFTPFTELTDLDAVIVTHQHFDHLDVERLPVLLEANDGARLLVETEAAAELDKVGIDAEALRVEATYTVGALTVTGVGGQHAVIHPEIPRIGNVGVLLQVDGEPTLFHPGDAYEYTPAGVDVLAMPLNAPWAKLSETVEFVRGVTPGRVFPIHDFLLKEQARGVYLGNIEKLLPEGTELLDLYGREGVLFGS